MIRFGSMSAFVAHLARLPATVAVAEHEGMKRAAELLRDKAKASLGTYQEAAGPLPAWASLSPVTQAERVQKGFTPDDPLLRTGGLRDSIVCEVGDRHARVWTDNEHAAELEFGTNRIPPRPFMGGAAFRHGHEVAHDVAVAVEAAFAGVPVKDRHE